MKIKRIILIGLVITIFITVITFVDPAFAGKCYGEYFDQAAGTVVPCK